MYFINFMQKVKPESKKIFLHLTCFKIENLKSAVSYKFSKMIKVYLDTANLKEIVFSFHIIVILETFIFLLFSVLKLYLSSITKDNSSVIAKQS